MDIRHFRYFLAVADQQSFVSAARSLNMTQPPLSKRILELEAEIGTRLFVRGPQGVKLTRAGETLLPHARQALNSFQAAEQVARALTPTTSRKVRIALPPESSRELIDELRRKLGEQGFDPQFLEASTAEQITQLAKGDADLGLPRYPFDPTGLESLEPLAQPLGVLMSARHPLAKQSSIGLHDMNPYPIVMFPREMAPGLHDELLATCRRGGYQPKRIFYSIMMMKLYLENDLAVTLMTERKGRKPSMSRKSDFVWRPIEGTPVRWWTSVVYRAHDSSTGLKRIAQIVDSCLQTSEYWERLPRPNASAF